MDCTCSDGECVLDLLELTVIEHGRCLGKLGEESFCCCCICEWSPLSDLGRYIPRGKVRIKGVVTCSIYIYILLKATTMAHNVHKSTIVCQKV